LGIGELSNVGHPRKLVQRMASACSEAPHTSTGVSSEKPSLEAALALRYFTLQCQWLVSRQLRAGLGQLRRCAAVPCKGPYRALTKADVMETTNIHAHQAGARMLVQSVDMAVQTEDLSSPDNSESADRDSGAEPTSSSDSHGASTQWHSSSLGARSSTPSQSSGTSRSTYASRHADLSHAEPGQLTSTQTSSDASNPSEHSSEAEENQHSTYRNQVMPSSSEHAKVKEAQEDGIEMPLDVSKCEGSPANNQEAGMAASTSDEFAQVGSFDASFSMPPPELSSLTMQEPSNSSGASEQIVDSEGSCSTMRHQSTQWTNTIG